MEGHDMHTVSYKVAGMTCAGCVRSLSNVLHAALPQVRIDIQLEGGQVRIDGPHDPAAVKQAVAQAGFDLLGR